MEIKTSPNRPAISSHQSLQQTVKISQNKNPPIFVFRFGFLPNIYVKLNFVFQTKSCSSFIIVRFGRGDSGLSCLAQTLNLHVFSRVFLTKPDF
jgi:hypothetical protein